jgi:dolichol-phosphate mannosyltransferase
MVQNAVESKPVKEKIKIDLSVIVPCYNEAKVIHLLQARLLEALGGLTCGWEVILVDDGSRDETLAMLAGMAAADPRFKVLSFSRNFGHQAAVCAGLDAAGGQAVGVIDADLQDPPEILLQCWRQITQGADVAYAVRRKRKEALWKRMCYKLFYRVLHALSDVVIPVDSGDFCVMSRRVVEAIKDLPERNLFMRGMRAWVGFKQVAVEYERPARAAGETKYSFRRLIRLASDGLFSFSVVPLRLATYAGLLAVAFSLLYAVFTMVWRIAGFHFMGHMARDLPGWATLITGMLFLHGIELLILGIIGEYIGRLYTETKQRPRYILQARIGFAAPQPPKDH